MQHISTIIPTTEASKALQLQGEGIEIRHLLDSKLSNFCMTSVNRLIEIELLLQKRVISEALAEAHLKYGDYTEAQNAMSIIAEANNR
jgi:hypothetical protein